MASPNDLTNLKRFKLWYGIVETTQDDYLTMAITTVSAQVLAWLERNSFASRTYTDSFDGQGTVRQFLRQWPVTDVTSVIIGTQTLQRANDVPGSSGNGYRFEVWDKDIPGDPCQVETLGPSFCRGLLNCSISYVAGYLQSAEPHTIASGKATADQPQGVWIGDSGVTLLDGTPLVKVGSAPATGEYAIDPAVTGGYLFNSADNGTDILISYSFCPFAVEQVVIEVINEVRGRRGRPGAIARSLAGQETGTFDVQRGLPAWATLALQPFRSVIPL